MDQIEKYYESQRKSFDRLDPSPKLWEDISDSLDGKPKTPKWFRIGWKIAATMGVVALLGILLSSPEKPGIREGVDIDHVSPDIVLQSPDGEPVALSSLEGKVVLVEFWASWCNVCSEKNCGELLPLYDEYKDKGFEIYAVSVDENERNWKDGINKYDLPWIHVSDFKGFASPISQRYGVVKTPSTFLLDQDRKIIGKNLTREELEAKLEQCYGSIP